MQAIVKQFSTMQMEISGLCILQCDNIAYNNMKVQIKYYLT
jgi:hypothetical protein